MATMTLSPSFTPAPLPLPLPLPRVAHTVGTPTVSRGSRVASTTGSQSIRLTRRGRRLARTVMVAMALGVALATALFGHISSSQASSSAAQAATSIVIVQPGQTMWVLAQQVAPNDDPRDTIVRILDLNSLPQGDSTTIHPGQRLVVPVRD